MNENDPSEELRRIKKSPMLKNDTQTPPNRHMNTPGMTHTTPMTPPARKIVFFSLSTALLGIALCSFIYAYQMISPPGVIEVSGNASINATPTATKITVTFTDVIAGTEDTNEAKERIEKATEDITLALTALGIPEDDIKTGTYSIVGAADIASIFSGDSFLETLFLESFTEDDSAGTLVNRTMSLVVTDTDIIENAKTLLIASRENEGGVDITADITPYIDRQTRDTLQQQALSQAMMDARKNIDTIEQHLGVKVKNVLSFTSSQKKMAYPHSFNEDKPDILRQEKKTNDIQAHVHMKLLAR